MERRALVGLVVLAGMVVGAGAGCETQKRRNNPYMTETGRAGQITDTPLEVQEFIKQSFPDAEVERVYEMRHGENYHMRHFEIHMVLPGGRKKVVDYNVFQKPSQNARQLERYEIRGAGTSPEAQQPGEPNK